MPSVTFSLRREEWIVRRAERSLGPFGELPLLREELGEITVADLRAAIRKYRGDDQFDISVTDVPEQYFEPEYAGGNVALAYDAGDLAVTARVYTVWPDDGDDDVAIAKITALTRPYLVARGATLKALDVDYEHSSNMALAVQCSIAVPWRGRTVADIVEVGFGVGTLCDAFREGNISRDTVADLVRGGSADLLIGQPEGNWLDAKRDEYDLTTSRGRISLAQAVARFANGEDGGLILIGAHAKKIPGGEEIRKAPGVVPRQNDTIARYLRILDSHLYPPAVGLRIDLVPTTDQRSLICVDVPPQSEELKPFLVHGAITAGGDVEGAFISIVQRRGEGSIPITAPMIHASIAAGRALLRGQNMPPNS